MEENKLIKYEGGLVQRVGDAISVTNKLLALAEPQLIPYRKKDKWGFCTPDKKIVVECVYNKAECFSDGLAAVQVGRKWGFINKNGYEVIPCNYNYVHSFKEELAVVKVNEKYGFVDKEEM